MSEQKLEQLAQITKAILDPGRPAYSLRDEILQLRSIFEASGGFSSETAGDISSGETITKGGVAISPTMAAMCLDDLARTVQFLRGVHDAISDLRGHITDRSIRVLYAGCGPLAPLAIPLMSIFDRDTAKFTLLDIHQESIRSTERIARSLDLTDRVQAFEIADASEFRIDQDASPDLIVVEMLRSALRSEPQVVVAKHLMLQAPEALLIPEEVRIDLALVDRSREFSTDESLPDRDRIPVATVFTLDRVSLVGPPSQPVQVELPGFDDSRYDPMLLTTVHVYGDHVLRDYDSGITCPQKLRTGERAGPNDRLEFMYRVGSEPELVVRKI